MRRRFIREGNFVIIHASYLLHLTLLMNHLMTFFAYRAIEVTDFFFFFCHLLNHWKLESTGFFFAFYCKKKRDWVCFTFFFVFINLFYIPNLPSRVEISIYWDVNF